MFKTAKAVRQVLRTFDVSAEKFNWHGDEVRKAEMVLWDIAFHIKTWQREQRRVTGCNGRIDAYLAGHSEAIAKALATLEAYCSETNRPALDTLRRLQITDDFTSEALAQAEALLLGEDWTAEALAQVEAVFA